MILVCGGLADRVTELVCARLTACGYAYHLLDLGMYPEGYQVDWSWRASCPEGYVAGPGWKIDLGELSGVFVRYIGPEGRMPLGNVPTDSVPALQAEYDAALALLLDDLPCAVVNRLGPGMSNHSKPYQALLVRKSGLLTPPTLVTNDPEEASRFVDEWHGEVIYKSLSGVRSIVRRLGPEQLQRLPLLRHAPAQFQAFIPGVNVRVHTVGDRLFATRVHSTAVDYRYAHREGAEVQMEAMKLPPDIAGACLRLADAMGLLFAGIDLKVTDQGEYYCFEVNPAPGFLYYEQRTGQPISAALADLLHGRGSASLPTSHTAEARFTQSREGVTQ